MKSVKDFYDKTANEWAEKWYNNESMLPCLKLFVNKFNNKATILDLCCGAGYESKRMKALGADVIGIDFSEKSIEIAKQKNPDIKFFVDDMLNDYSYAGMFDGIAIIAGLVHISNEKLLNTFESMIKVLKKDGLVLIVVQEGSGKKEKSITTIDGEQYDRDFYAHTLDELIKHSDGIFTFVEEILPNEKDSWKRYLFQRQDEV